MQEKEPRTAEQIAEETLATLKSIERASKQQAFYTKVCASGTIATAILVVVAVIAGFIAYQKAAAAVEDVMEQIDGFSAQLTSLDLSEMNDSIAGMVENIDDLVSESRDGIAAATESMSEIDISSLNDAIEDLQDVMEPLASFFNIF